MDAQKLRDLQAPIKAKYKENPDAAVIRLKAVGDIDAMGIACKVDTGRAIVEAGLHPMAGGDGTQACSGDMLLEALVACAGVTLKAVATALAIELRSAKVIAEGDIDARGTLGVDREAPVGFREIRLRFEVDSPAAPDQLQKLYQLTERYCVIYQTLKNPPPLKLAG